MRPQASYGVKGVGIGEKACFVVVILESHFAAKVSEHGCDVGYQIVEWMVRSRYVH